MDKIEELKERTKAADNLSASYEKDNEGLRKKIAKKKAMARKMRVPKKYRGNTNSEGGIPFGKAPKGEK